MNNEKQQKILEMAKDICRVKLNCNDVCNPISACDALKYAERAVEAGYSKPEWISVDERLPEKGTNYLCRCVIRDDVDYPFFMVLGYILIDENPHFQHKCNDGLRVTHWMPLPEAPKMKGENK